jgi:hypothetical protein
MNYNGLGGVDDLFQYETVTGTQLTAIRSDMNDPKVRQA